MSSNIKVIQVFFFLLLLQPSILAQSSSDRQAYIEIKSENDTYYLRLPSDRYYTSGNELTLQARSFEVGTLAFGKLFPFRYQKYDATNYSKLRLTHQLYSPFSIRWEKPQELDRPYAGLIDLSFINKTFLAHRSLSIQKMVQLGMIGPSTKGREIQTWYHQVKGSPEPKAWDYQLADRPFWHIQIQLEKAILRKPNQLLLIVPNIKFGNIQQFGKLGLRYAMGDIDRYFIPDQWSREQLHWYGYVQLDGQFVAKNEFINGPLRPTENLAQFTSPTIHHLLGLASYGFVFERKRWELQLSQHASTPTFKGASSHYYGVIAIRRYY